MQPWIDALRAVDRTRDAAPLVALLKSDAPLPADARWLIADLLGRYNLKRPQGGRPTPAYDLSDAARRLLWAADAVKREVELGRNRYEAVESAARVYGVADPETLQKYLSGKHGSARRQKKRQPPTS
ncbi:MAG: hypothetical protein GEU76_01170 [Alphaproteobacteria bacterium]|nr:hypothetical protein [Alphaproteobacteria bacterium]